MLIKQVYKKRLRKIGRCPMPVGLILSQPLFFEEYTFITIFNTSIKKPIRQQKYLPLKYKCIYF